MSYIVTSFVKIYTAMLCSYCLNVSLQFITFFDEVSRNIFNGYKVMERTL